MVTNTTVCHVINGTKLLLIHGTRGINKGKWNGPGGKIEPGEDPERSALRELQEETGLNANHLLYHGTLKFYNNGGKQLSILNYLFSTKEFNGETRATEEGELKWFDISKMPYESMWADDIYWIDLMFSGQRFDAEFYFDETNSKVVEYKIHIKS